MYSVRPASAVARIIARFAEVVGACVVSEAAVKVTGIVIFDAPNDGVESISAVMLPFTASDGFLISVRSTEPVSAAFRSSCPTDLSRGSCCVVGGIGAPRPAGINPGGTVRACVGSGTFQLASHCGRSGMSLQAVVMHITPTAAQ